MKKTILATVIAATFLAGCSSNGSSNTNPELDQEIITRDEWISTNLPTDDPVDPPETPQPDNGLPGADRNPGTDPLDPGEGTPGTPPTGDDDHGLDPIDPPETPQPDNGLPGADRNPGTDPLDPGEGTPGTPPTGDDDHGLNPIDPPSISTGNVKWEVTAKNDDFIQINEVNGDRYVQIVKNPDGTVIIQDQDGNRIERPDAGWGFIGWNGDNGWGNDQTPEHDVPKPAPELPPYNGQIKLETGGWITANGEPIARAYYYNNAGIPTISVDGINGNYEVKITKHPAGDQVTIFVNGELVKVAEVADIKERLDNSWGANNDRSPGTDPLDPDEGTPGTPPTGDDDHGLEPVDPPETPEPDNGLPGADRNPGTDPLDPDEGTPGTPPTGDDDHGLEPVDPPEMPQPDNGLPGADRNPGTDPLDPGEGTPGIPPTGDDDHGLDPIDPPENDEPKPTPELPIHEAQIKLENGGWITADGEPIARAYYYNNAGIPTITVEGINGNHEVKITKHPAGDQVTMFVNGELVKVADVDDIKERLDNGWGMSAAEEKQFTAEQKSELKNRVKSLSVEQRQQLKQAVKTRLQTRS